MIRGAVRDLGKALSLPPEEVDQLSKQSDYYGSARHLESQMQKSAHFQEKIKPRCGGTWCVWPQNWTAFPKYMGQHPGGMIISSPPLIDIVPVVRGAIDGRYVCQWDKDSIDDAGFVKIDFLALGALSQLQEAVELIKQAHRQKNRYVAHRFRGQGGLRHALQRRYHRHLSGRIGGADADHHPPATPQPAGHGA